MSYSDDCIPFKFSKTKIHWKISKKSQNFQQFSQTCLGDINECHVVTNSKLVVNIQIYKK